MDVVLGVSSLKNGPGSVGGVIFSGAPGLVAQVDISGWLRAGVFLSHHKLECGEASAMEYSREGWPW